MTKPFELTCTVDGKEILFGLDQDGYWHVGPAAQMEAYDNTAGGHLKS